MAIFRFFFKRSRALMVLASLTSIASGLCSTGLLVVFNSCLTSGSKSALLAASFLALCLLLPLSRFTSECLLSRLGQSALLNIRLELIQSVLRGSLDTVEKVGSHRVLAGLTEDALSITNALLNIPVLCVNLSLTLGCLGYLVWLSPRAAAVLLAFIVVGVAFYEFALLYAHGLLDKARDATDQLMKHFRSLTSGIKDLKINRSKQREFLSRSLIPTASAARDLNVQSSMIYAFASSVGQVLLFIVTGLFLFQWVPWHPVDEAARVGYLVTLIYLLSPIQVVLNTLPALARANAALHRLERIKLSLGAETAGESDDAATSSGVIREWKHIEARGLRYTHAQGSPDAFTAGPFDLTLEPGEIVFITGGNGSGKTTLLKLLLGLYKPHGGQLLLDGRAVSTSGDLLSYRTLFSVVFADSELFDTILGVDPDKLNECEALIERLGLAGKVTIQDGRFSTVDLSQGQRKRLLLLCAYLEDRPVYLFDEWAADQDPVFKRFFYTTIIQDLKERGKALILVSHDDEYYEYADRLIKLTSGKSEPVNVLTTALS